jgi:transposase InsO family protein
MSRRGNCRDNEVAESFFSSLKKKERERQSIKLWMKRERNCLITERCSIVQDFVTAILEALVQKHLKVLNSDC